MIVNNVVDEVLITLPVKSCYTQIQDAIEVCERLGVESKYLSEIFAPSFATAGYERLEGFAVTSLKPVVDDARFMVKRAIDMVGASLGHRFALALVRGNRRGHQAGRQRACHFPSGTSRA